MEQDSFLVDHRLFSALERSCETSTSDEGGTLFRQGEDPHGVYLIRSGEANLLKLSPAGRMLLSFHAGPGSVLGIPASVGNTPYTLTANVRKGSVTGFVQHRKFHSLLRNEPSLYPYVLTILASEIRVARNAVAIALDDGHARNSSQRAKQLRSEMGKPVDFGTGFRPGSVQGDALFRPE